MSAKLLDGRAVCDEILSGVAARVEDLKGSGWTPRLVSIKVGDNPAVELYIRNQRRKAEQGYARFMTPQQLRDAGLEEYIDQIPEFEGATPESWPAFFTAARRFVGNEQMGYKMALCERDIGIYGFVLVGGLLFGLLRYRLNIKPLPFVLFLIIGIGPIALDGFSQLFSYWVTPIDGSAAGGALASIQQVLPLRESPPALRAATGALFGLMLVWLAYPQVEKGMKGTEKGLAEKLRRAEQRQDSDLSKYFKSM